MERFSGEHKWRIHNQPSRISAWRLFVLRVTLTAL
jgi:hypothetical protein